MRQLAERAGVSKSRISARSSGGCTKPSAEVLESDRSSAATLGGSYSTCGPEFSGRQPSQVHDAINGDTAITERQKHVLLDIYTSFCQQNRAAEEPPAD